MKSVYRAPANHGTRKMYRDEKCRCEECSRWLRESMREYRRMRLEQHGISVDTGRPPASCSLCGKRCMRRGESEPKCRACWAATKAIPAHVKRRRRAEKKATRAAAGMPANPRWAFVAGACGWCQQPFVRRGEPSRFCSKRCNQRWRRRESRVLHGKRWISDADRYAIYERDDWTCQICLEPVDRSAHYLDNKAPSLDHIECRSWVLIPDHSPRNLRLACRLCNSKRGDETYAT